MSEQFGEISDFENMMEERMADFEMEAFAEGGGGNGKKRRSKGKGGKKSKGMRTTATPF